MSDFSLVQLLELLNESGERDESVEVVLDESRADWDFEELGFDSLALFNVVAQIEKRFSVEIGYDAITDAKTPRRLLDVIRRHLSNR